MEVQTLPLPLKFGQYEINITYMNFIKMNQTNGYIYVRESKKLGYLNKMVILIKIFIKIK